ncbi:MAG TPA: flagellar hook protein FlgE [Bryobacteraceae bacterium]|nr:flagellar hook protein FlgE [Bryobacteraceae bacterium]
MLGSFSTALSALTADETAINVVGNNLANLNTDGFKHVVVSFADLVSQSLGAETQVGSGVGAPVTLAQFSQGAIQATGGPLDAAIQGDGFFVVAGPNGAVEYTRGGNFQVNADGTLETASGNPVQGWSTSANAVLDTNGPVGNITVPTGNLTTPTATSAASVSLNLNATATTATGTFSTAVTVYDSLGNSHILTFTMTPTGTPNQWSYSAGIPGADASTVTPATGTLTFDTNGNLISPAPTDAPPLISATGMNDGASDMNITWNLYDANGNPQLTQFAQTSATSAVTQNGAPSANLSSVSLGNGGQVIALYSNSEQVVVGQLAMASIRNPDSLANVGGNNYVATGSTSLAAVGLPGTGGRGLVLGQSVESSTVDMATEFTNLIIFQRSYEANAHVVTTVDQMSQDTINLKP